MTTGNDDLSGIAPLRCRSCRGSQEWFYKPHLPRKHTEKPGQDHKLHAGTAITREVVNSRSWKVLCFSVFRVFPWLK